MKKLIGFLFALMLLLVLCAGIASAAEEAPLSDKQFVEDEPSPITDGDEYENESDWQHATAISELNGWQKIDGTWYFYQDGYRVTGWQKISGIWYYLDANAEGAMLKGWQRIDGLQYYFRSSGAMATGWQQIYNEDLGVYKWYYFRAGGSQATGWQQIGGIWYYLNKGSIPTENYMLTGWQHIGSKWYFLKSSGVMATGWFQDGSKWYYLSSSGAMATGWVQVGSKWYYMNSSGVMQTGWIQVSGKWYYLKSSGAMQTGWVKMTPDWNDSEPLWYYFKSSGVLATGWQQIDGKWYYFWTSEDGDPTNCWMASDGIISPDGTGYLLSSSGALVTTPGWHSFYSQLKGDNVWVYVMNNSGKLAVGWQDIGNSRYYFYESGYMAYTMVANTSERINGNLYLFSSSGALVQKTGWSELACYYVDEYGNVTDKWLYYSKNGSTLVTGWQVINGVTYYFDEIGRKVSEVCP